MESTDASLMVFQAMGLRRFSTCGQVNVTKVNSKRVSKSHSKAQALMNKLPIILSWLAKEFIGPDQIDLGEFKYLLDQMNLVLQTRGVEEFVVYTKNLRLSLKLYLSGESKDKRVEKVAVTSDGIPMALGPLARKVRVSPSPALLQLLFTCLTISRALSIGKVADVAPITDPVISGTSEVDVSLAKSFWQSLGYRASSTVPGSLRFKKFHRTSKAGPNGHALWNSPADASLITPDLEAILLNVGGPRLISLLRDLKNGLDLLPSYIPSEGSILRKLSLKLDKEMKVRVIAIGDYYSQCALKPLHHYLFRVLRKIPQDCTFDQGSFTEKIKGWTEYYSIDLSSATDRFPISFIQSVMEGQLPKSYCESWKQLMVGLPFELPTNRSIRLMSGNKPLDSKLPVSYSVGNPMGFYSSWASFAVSHHYVMFLACRNVGILWREAPYVLLGDDIAIGNKDLATEYKKLISDLGVKFAPLKTFESQTFLEFAQRLFFNGLEITPFPISALEESAKRYYLLVSLLLESVPKGWNAINGIPCAISSFYEYVRPYPSSIRKGWETRSLISEQVIKVTRGAQTAAMALNTIIRCLEFPFPTLSEKTAFGLLSNIVVECFADSNPQNSKSDTKGFPLGELPMRLVMHFTGFEDETDLVRSMPLLQALPVLPIYGEIEECYIKALKEARRIDSGALDWPLTLKSMVLPLDDTIFVQRTAHLAAKASAVIGDRLLERFEILREYPSLLSDN